METLTQALFAAGTVVLAFAFAATIGHAVMLANGRRLAGALVPGATGVVRPAWAGVATSAPSSSSSWRRSPRTPRVAR